MRYAAFLLLFLLFLYLFFVKPFVESLNLRIHAEGFDVNLERKTLSLREFYLYLGHNLFLSLRRLHMGFPATLSADELIFIRISEKKTAGRPSEEKQTGFVVPEWIGSLNIRINRALVTLVNPKGFVSAEGRNLKLSEGAFRGNLGVSAGKLFLEISLNDIYIKGEKILIGDVKVASDLFKANLKGEFLLPQQKGSFAFEGYTAPLDRKAFRVERVTFKGEANVTRKGLKAQALLSTKAFILKERDVFRDLRGEVYLNLPFGGEVSYRGFLENHRMFISFSGGREKLFLKAERFFVDSKLLGIGVPLLGWVEGEGVYSFSKKELEVLLGTEHLFVGGESLGRSLLYLFLSFGDGFHGRVEVFGNGNLVFSGGFEGKEFLGRGSVRGYPIARSGLWSLADADFKVSYRDKPIAQAEGKLNSLSFRDVNLPPLSFSFRLEGKSLEVAYRAKGFEGSAKGVLGKNLISINSFRNFTLPYRDFEIDIAKATAELSLYGGKVFFAFKGKGSVAGKNVLALLSATLKLEKTDSLWGELEAKLESLKVGDREFKEGLARLEVEDTSLTGYLELKDIFRGDLKADLETKRLSLSGKVAYAGIEGSYQFSGSLREGSFTFNGTALKGDLPLRVDLSYEDKNLNLKVGGTFFRRGAVSTVFEGAKAEGTFEKVKIEVGSLQIRVLNRTALSVLFRPSELDLKRKGFSLEGVLEGVASGGFKLAWNEEEGFLFRSKGEVDLERLSFFTATPVGGKLRGTLSYEVSYEKGVSSAVLESPEPAVMHSRYLQLPTKIYMDGHLYGKACAVFLTLWNEKGGINVHVGSLDLKNFYVYFISRDLPLRYVNDFVKVRPVVTAEGWVWVKDLKQVSVEASALLGGEVKIEKIPSAGKGSGEKKEGKPPLEITVDVKFDTLNPIRVRLPEGYANVRLQGWVLGKAPKLESGIGIEFLSGELFYFGRNFFVKGGLLEVLKTPQEEEKRIDITVVNPADEETIFINLRGDLSDPEILVWSEPPKDPQEILTKLIVGSSAEGLIPVADALLKEFGHISELRKGIASALGVDLSFSTETSAQGEVGVSVKVRRKIAQIFSVEFQQSTLKDPRKTYMGVSLHVKGGISLQGRSFSDNSSEIRLRFIRKFDF